MLNSTENENDGDCLGSGAPRTDPLFSTNFDQGIDPGVELDVQFATQL